MLKTNNLTNMLNMIILKLMRKEGLKEGCDMNKRILVVDDQGDLRQLVKMTLEYADYELHEAGNGIHALGLLAPLRPDLIVLDIMVPGSPDGLELCEIIKCRPNLTHIKVLLLSAKGQRSDIERGRQAGADGYLVKPFSPLELIETVERMLSRKKFAH